MNKIQRLQIMDQIRNMLVDGFNYSDIIAKVGVSERSFYRYLRKIFAADVKTLEKTTNEAMMRAVSLHVQRANNIFRGLNALASDPTVDAESRRLTYNDMYKLSAALIETYANAPSAAWNVRKKLAALDKGGQIATTTPLYPGYSSGYYHLPPAIHHPSSQQEQEQRYQEQVHEEQRQEQQAAELVRAGDITEGEEEEQQEQQQQEDQGGNDQQQHYDQYGRMVRRDWWNI